MVVGFVNAGLMSLTQSIGVIFGANIGTTITGWIIAIKIGKYSLLLIGLGIFPLLFSKNQKVQDTAKIIFALGMVFLGLKTMSGAFKPLRSDAGFLAMMTYFAAEHYFSLLATIGIGCILTFVVQSSSAMLGITIALASTGAISFQTAAALVLGENIGTTITALLAGVTANRMARRAAFAHGLFNVFGVVVLSTFFWKYLELVDFVIPGVPDAVNDSGAKPNIAAHIAAGHTIFNVTNVLIFLPFLNVLARIVTRLVPDAPKKEKKQLEYFGPLSTLSPSMAILQAEKTLQKMADLVMGSINDTKEYLSANEDRVDLRRRVLKYEKISDKIHHEMVLFFGHVMQARLTPDDSEQVKAMLRISDELESISDYCQKIVLMARRFFDEGNVLGSHSKQDFDALFEAASTYFTQVKSGIFGEDGLPVGEHRKRKEAFDELLEKCRQNGLDNLAKESYSVESSLTLAEINLSLRRIFSHSRNVYESHQGMKSASIEYY
jgi:phosphate:Na+ symporter